MEKYSWTSNQWRYKDHLVVVAADGKEVKLD